jgi:hypothetical protein
VLAAVALVILAIVVALVVIPLLLLLGEVVLFAAQAPGVGHWTDGLVRGARSTG